MLYKLLFLSCIILIMCITVALINISKIAHFTYICSQPNDKWVAD